VITVEKASDQVISFAGVLALDQKSSRRPNAEQPDHTHADAIFFRDAGDLGIKRFLAAPPTKQANSFIAPAAGFANFPQAIAVLISKSRPTANDT
jgi:hypothetical protein